MLLVVTLSVIALSVTAMVFSQHNAADSVEQVRVLDKEGKRLMLHQVSHTIL